MGRWIGGVVLAAICLAVYLPGQRGIAAVDRDESRFAQASRQMLRSESAADWVVPRVQDRPRLNKPPLIYWMQAGSAGVFTGRWTGTSPAAAAGSDAIWMYRVPSILGAIVAVLGTWRLGCSMFDARAGWVGALLLALSPIVWWESHQARADLALLGWTVLAMWGLWTIASKASRGSRASPWVAAGMWLAVGAGVMTKGPITPMVVVLTGVAFAAASRRWAWWRRVNPVLGLVLVAACVVPWVVLVAREVGWDAYLDRIRDEVVGRSLEAKEGHTGWPGYYVLATPVVLGAGSLMLVPGLSRAWRVGLRGWRARRPAEAFLLCWIAPAWIVFEVVRTKLPHYTMPILPALALLSARAMLGAWAPAALRGTFARVLVWAWRAGMWGAIAAGGVAAWYVVRSSPAAIAGVGAATFALGAVATRLMLSRFTTRAQIGGLVAMVGLEGAVAFALPRTEEARVSVRVVEAISRVDPAGTRAIAAAGLDGRGFQEDSLIFETRGRAARVGVEALPAFRRDHPGAIVVWEDRLGEPPAGLVERAAVAGFNYAKGRRVRVRVLEDAP